MTPELRAHLQHLVDADTDRCMQQVQDEINAAIGIPKNQDLTFATAFTQAVSPPPKTLTIQGLKAMLDKLDKMGVRQKGAVYTHPSVIPKPFKTVRPDMTHPTVSNHQPNLIPPDLFPYERKFTSIFGMRVVESANLPTRLIGHWFADVPPSKNRSKRLWKKLRYGTRRNNKVRQMREEVVLMLGPSDMVVSPTTANQFALLTQPVKE